jgi:tocopherol O-methyltransferase
MLNKKSYYENIASYYKQTLNSYKDGWKMDEAHAIHYGYWDAEVNNFAASLLRMNAVMAEEAGIKEGSLVLDAGCGVGGSSFYLAQKYNCTCIGISLSEEQMQYALAYQKKLQLEQQTRFEIMDYCQTGFANNSFDVVWGCESICYAFDKKALLKEVYRILKPGGVFIMADGMVSNINNNNHATIRKWLDGWQVNYLETPNNWLSFASELQFTHAYHKDITRYTKQSSKRLLSLSVIGKLTILYNKWFGNNKWTAIQRNNINACWHQYWGMRKGLWNYGLIKMIK